MQRSQQALTLAQELAHPYSLATTQHFAAYLHYYRREAPAVHALAEALLTLAAAQRFSLLVGFGACWQGWALAIFEASGRGDMLAEAHRLQGEFLLRQATPDATHAEACFRQAIALALRQQAKSWELRAAISLARLWRHQGKRDEAYNLLAPIYGWFTEGFDTADLQEAKGLLEELS